MITDLAAGVMALVGSLFILLASIGILRMPDLFLRLQVTSKASVMGLTCILLAVALHFSTMVVTLRVGLIICFIVLTIPVATHMLARAGYATNVPISEETVVNELAGHYDPQKHVLASEEPTTWDFELMPNAAADGKRVADLKLPADVLILSINRQGEVLVPRGQTILAAKDKLKVFAKSEQLDAVRDILGVPATELAAAEPEDP